MGNKLRTDFYKERAGEIALFLFYTREIENNPYVQLVLNDVHPIVDVILKELEMAEDLKDLTGYDTKYRKCDYISDKAKKAMKEKEKITLQYEHIVPKKNVIFAELKTIAANKKLSLEELQEKIYEVLIKYYYVATITKEENKLLDSKYRNDMPDGWKPGDDIKARYTEIGISVQPTKLFDD